jgi:hypothetical protein
MQAQGSKSQPFKNAAETPSSCTASKTLDDRVHVGEASDQSSIVIESTIAWSSERCFADVPT